MLLGLDQSPSDQEAARAQLKSAMDGLNAAAAKAKDAKVRAAMSALADDYRQILDAVAAGQLAPTGLDDKLGKDCEPDRRAVHHRRRHRLTRGIGSRGGRVWRLPALVPAGGFPPGGFRRFDIALLPHGGVSTFR